jgi:hypothetical protein
MRCHLPNASPLYLDVVVDGVSEEPESTEDTESSGQDRETDGRIHFSRLKLMSRSPAHYHANVRKFSPSFALGRATHSYILEDESKLVVYEGRRYDGMKYPKSDGPVKAYLDWKATVPSGVQIVSSAEMWDVRGMRMAIDRHPTARGLLTGFREEYIQWESADGHPCAGTPDVWRIRDGQLDVTELKTDDCVEPGSFRSAALRYSYHAQLCWYATGIMLRSLDPPPRLGKLSIVAVESSAPYCVTVVELDENDIAEGNALWRGWLARLAQCEALGEWPGYTSETIRGLRA